MKNSSGISVKRLLVIFALISQLPGQTAGNKEIAVTPVTGESWISHLHKKFSDTSMGKTWHAGPAAPGPGEDSAVWQEKLSPGFEARSMTLHGSDVYRLNCRGCHTASGRGAPPEINSVIDPVRSTSVKIIMERMKKVGMDMSRANATVLAKEADTALLDRFHKGGKDMPPFPQLSQTEIRALVAYLRLLAGIPGAEKQQVAITESPARVGEQIVKSTCHICHNAVGPNPSPQEILEGAIPPLGTLTARTTLSQFVRKVTFGNPITMGAPPEPFRGRMPVFDYLSQDEAANAYLYLTLYPPQQ
ncbi:MAG TPA: cytochrome c [Terriglobales bacterium]|nr:cytochrome c [Terriglobales bacterium]